uniref:Uncharacterized protein n=2 Tax=Sinocyclocheilus TaxID=75365 RepID=A0A671M6T9_9TELE
MTLIKKAQLTQQLCLINSPLVRRRPTSVVGYKRPVSQYAQAAVATGSPSRYRAENIMLLELDISPPTMVPLDLQRSDIRTQDLIHDFGLYRKRTTASRVMKARSWLVSCTSSIIQLLPRNLQ